MSEPDFPSDADILARAQASLKRDAVGSREPIRPAQASQLFGVLLARLPYEEFHALWLDAKGRAIAVEMLFRGGLDGVAVSARTVVHFALAHGAAAVVFAHNHPSGDPTPTHSDLSLTARLIAALDLIDIRVLDHFVVGDNVVSMRKTLRWPAAAAALATTRGRRPARSLAPRRSAAPSTHER